MTEVILALNTGSSSIKAAAYDVAADSAPLWKGEIDAIGRRPQYASRRERDEGEAMAVPEKIAATHRALIEWMLERLQQECPTLTVVAAGHRVVHGGRHFDAPVRVTQAVLKELRGLSSLAPSHQPHNLAGIDAVADTWPDIAQIACFDTAFHRSQPRIAQLFALPRQLCDEGVLRYGFHGLSYEYIADTLPAHLGERAEGRVIVAHLGHGASLCALRGRRSMATSMGFTALDGLVMGKRCGAIDPGIVLYLLRDRGMSVDQVETLLSRQSGLLGISGISDDMRDLQQSDDPHAREAIDLFVYRALSQLGALVMQLGGLDALVFTAGIGEHSPAIRERITTGLDWLGVRLDASANRRDASLISAADSALPVLVIPTDEEAMILRHTRALL